MTQKINYKQLFTKAKEKLDGNEKSALGFEAKREVFNFLCLPFDRRGDSECRRVSKFLNVRKFEFWGFWAI